MGGGAPARAGAPASVSLSGVRLVLASASPRRADLLRSAGFQFQVVPVDVDERLLAGEDPAVMVQRLATEKAALVSDRVPDGAVIGADTVVVVDGVILGKPGDDRDAAGMLRRLSGRSHEVLTGVAVHANGRRLVAVERTVVWFLPLSDADIAWYVSSGEPLDKAGAYAVQGLASRFVTRIEGSYSNVVGLPVARVCELLNRITAC